MAYNALSARSSVGTCSAILALIELDLSSSLSPMMPMRLGAVRPRQIAGLAG